MSQETKILGGIGVITVLVTIAAVFFLSINKPEVASLQTVDSAILSNNALHKITASEAKVTIVEFADFQCPACKQAFPELKKILETYTGKINFIYRHFPLPQHAHAQIASRAAEAASDQGKFWEMSELLYTRQNEWSVKQNARDIFIGYAEELGLNKDQFSTDLDSKKFDATINTDLQDAAKVGVNSTPTIFVNGKKIVLPPTYENLRSEIERQLRDNVKEGD